MKHLELTSRTLLGLALMGAWAAAPMTTSVAIAAPNRGDIRRADRDDQGRNRGGRRSFDDRNDNASRRGGRDGQGRVDDRGGEGRDSQSRFDDRRASVPQFVGVVTKVKTDREFDVRIGDTIYNVYLTAPSNRVSIGQTVSLDGERIGRNDIRSASLIQSQTRRR